MNATPSRRRFRFSLRTALILLTLACFAAAWVGHRLNWIRQRHEARSTVTIGATRNVAAAPGLLWMFGEKGEAVIILDETKLAGAEVDRIKGLFPESEFLSITDLTWGVENSLNISNR